MGNIAGGDFFLLPFSSVPVRVCACVCVCVCVHCNPVMYNIYLVSCLPHLHTHIFPINEYSESKGGDVVVISPEWQVDVISRQDPSEKRNGAEF